MEKPQIKVRFEDTVPVICEECGCDTFVSAAYIRIVPRLLIGAQQDEPKMFQTFVCSKCGKVPPQFRMEVTTTTPVIAP